MMKASKVTLVIILILSISLNSYSQKSDTLNSKRLIPLVASTAVVYGGSLYSLNKLWYSQDDRTSFRWFNDNPEWLQMDKAGHFFAGYHISSISNEGLIWSGVDEHKAMWWGAATSLIMLLPIEWMDGHSESYGASAGDIVADVAGSAFFLGQQALWGEQKIIPKFSFSRSPYAEIRPDVLGNGLHEEWLKDYNGQTYWLSFDMDKFITTDSNWLKYVNVAVGYSGEGMVFGRTPANEAAGYNPHRQFYLAPDLDLTAIPTKSKFIKTCLFLLNMIHLPAPTIAFGDDQWKFHMFYF